MHQTKLNSRKHLTTIVIPCFNSSSTIGITLDSLARQSLQDFSVIVVDDCSADNSVQIARSYKSKLTIRIIELDHNSGGPARPRNIGIESCATEYVTLFDSDDIALPTMVASINQLLSTHDPDALFNPLVSSLNLAKLIGSVYKKNTILDCDQLARLLRRMPFPFANTGTTYRLSLFQDKMIFYDDHQNLISAEDSEILYQLLNVPIKIFVGASPIAIYSENQATSIQKYHSKVTNISFIINKHQLRRRQFPGIYASLYVFKSRVRGSNIFKRILFIFHAITLKLYSII
jgi:glycosyltransferase involved in cell wall biosynthesis